MGEAFRGQMDVAASTLAMVDQHGVSTRTANQQSAPTENENSINVFVTGMGPFPDGLGGHFDTNSSHELTKLLPSSLAPNTPANPTAVKINILNPTAGEGRYVETSYKYIRAYVKHLHTFGYPPVDDGETGEGMRKPRIDVVVHLGQADGWGFVSIEKVAYGQGMSSTWWSPKESDVSLGYYQIPDEYNETITSCGDSPWTRVPTGLRPALDIEEVQKSAEKRLDVMHESATHGKSKHIPVLTHSEAGPYCCGFIFYESLANCFVLGKKADVLFCHVPGEMDRVSLEAARDCVVAVIGAAGGKLLERRGREVGLA